jgi:hypothetical protein
MNLPELKATLATIFLAAVTLVDILDVWIKIGSGCAAIIVAIFAIINYASKTRLNKIDAALKKKEMERLDQEIEEVLARKKKRRNENFN